MVFLASRTDASGVPAKGGLFGTTTGRGCTANGRNSRHGPCVAAAMRLNPFPFSWRALRAVFAAGFAARYAGVRPAVRRR